MKSVWRWFVVGFLLAAFFGDGVAGSATIIWTTMGVFLACAVCGWLLRLVATCSPRRKLPENVVPLRRVR
jgi:hypothetical protein